MSPILLRGRKGREMIRRIGVAFAVLALLGIAAGIAARQMPTAMSPGDGLAAITDGERLDGTGYTVRVASAGDIDVEVNGDRYHLMTETYFPPVMPHIVMDRPKPTPPDNGVRLSDRSPGPRFSAPIRRKPPEEQRLTSPILKRQGARFVTWEISCKLYCLHRTVTLDGQRILVRDELSNTSDQGLRIGYSTGVLCASGTGLTRVSGNTGAPGYGRTDTPCLYARQSGSGLGIRADDPVFRLLDNATRSGAHAMLMVEGIAFRPHTSRTFAWSAYALDGDADFWAFANAVQRSSPPPPTITGPLAFYDLGRCQDGKVDWEDLEVMVATRQVRVVAFTPAVDFGSRNTIDYAPISRSAYRSLAQSAMAAVKRINPGIRCIGLISGDLLPVGTWRRGDNEQIKPGVSLAPSTVLDDFARMKRECSDCIIKTYQDIVVADDYYYNGLGGIYRGGALALRAYASPRNGMHKRWVDQARFLLEDVKLDGIYLARLGSDERLSARSAKGVWDGLSPAGLGSGGIEPAPMTNIDFAEMGPRNDLADYVTKRGGIVLADATPATVAASDVRVLQLFDHADAVSQYEQSMSHDFAPATPLGLSLSRTLAAGDELDSYGRFTGPSYDTALMEKVMSLLKGGMLYYDYHAEFPRRLDQASSAPTASPGVYEAIARMYPITPIERHAGWIRGPERTVTCVSGTFLRASKSRPVVHGYDLNGNRVEPPADVVQDRDHWRVKLTLKDGAELAIIE